ncbi:MAG: shikimate dehydrogenase [Lentisphaerae bacterium]|nr:shikimate dehydrogenase [Lentisphaerota bacterium]
MKLSGHTIPFAVFGHPIKHTLSPVMHNASIAALDMDAIYLAFDVHPDRLMETLPAAAAMGFGGINLTVPLKEVAFRGINDLAESAKRLGAVNTVEFLENGLMKGHNTDGYGFVTAIKEAFQRSVKGLSVFILGAGGAGRAIAITCACEGAGSIIVTDTKTDRSQQVAKEINKMVPGILIQTCPPVANDWIRCAAGSDMIVQATPTGMKRDDESLLPSTAFYKGQMVFDLVYMYPETKLMAVAHSAGAKTVNGLGMLLHQGAKAFNIWTGKQPAVEVMRKALENEVYKK